MCSNFAAREFGEENFRQEDNLVSEPPAAETLPAIQIQATVGSVKVRAVFDLWTVGQFFGVEPRAALHEEGQRKPVDCVAAALEET